MTNTKTILNFLEELSENNEIAWLHQHQDVRNDAIKEFESLIEGLEYEIMDFDNSISFCPPKELTFRLNRDTRFSKDKSPYNPSFRAHISSKGKSPIPVGYFISIKPGNNSFIGGGLFADMFSEATALIREYITAHDEEFVKIISKKDFTDNFTVYGTKLKKVPKQYNPSPLVSEYVKNKSWFLEYKISDEELLSYNTIEPLIVEKFSLMKEFNDFLNKALVDFQMPKRK